MKLRTCFMMMLACALLVTGVYATGNSEELEYIPESQGFYYEALMPNTASLMSDDSDAYAEGIQKILVGLENHNEQIYFDEDDFVFTIDESNYDTNGKFIPSQFSSIYHGLIYKHPELFYLKSGFQYLPDVASKTYVVKQVTPNYSMNATETNIAKPQFKALTEEIAQYINENGKSDLEKAILLHDYIVLNFEYDSTKTIFDAYTFLKVGKGVCESYSKLYRYVLGLCDIESKYASSDAMNHLWNIVNIDNEWYHVDVTWDDSGTTDPETGITVLNIPGKITHDYFLIGDTDFQSNAIFGENIHYAYQNEDGIECKETYKDAFWGHKAKATKDGFVYADSPLVFDSQNYYYTAYNSDTIMSSVVARSKTTGEEKNVVTFSELWKVPGKDSFWPGNYSGLSLIDGVLIYNTPTEIRYVLPNGKHDTCIKKIQYTDAYFGNISTGYIYRFVTSLDGKFYEYEPYYTHIDPKTVKTGKGQKSDYKDGKDMFRIEIDYFIAQNPGSYRSWERDIDVHISFDDVHKESEITLKPSYVTPGEKRKICTECDNYETLSSIPPLCQEGENAHEQPVIEDVQNVIKAIIGVGPLADENEVDNDVDNDGKFSMHDIFMIFKSIRDMQSSSKS